MKFTRRSFIGIAALGSIIGGLFISLFIAKEKNNQQPYLDTLTSYLDTLIPKYKQFIAASEAGVVSGCLELAAKDQPFSDLLESGCQWLDAVASKQFNTVFSSLDEQQRGKIIQLAENSWIANASKTNIPGYFFTRTRDTAYRLYYQHPLSWQALHYKGPPQPNGFPAYADNPVPGNQVSS